MQWEARVKREGGLDRALKDSQGGDKWQTRVLAEELGKKWVLYVIGGSA